MSHRNNDQHSTKRSKLSRLKKQGKKDAIHPTVTPLLAVADLNETCDFKQPMTFKKTSGSVASAEDFCKAVQSSNPFDDTETVLCQVCNKDISHMNSVCRSRHVNRCIDKIEEKQKEDEKAVKQTKQANKSPVPDCPMCRRSFKSAKSRQGHLKQCAIINNIATEEMLKLVRNQEQVMEMKQDEVVNQSKKESKTTKPVQSRKRKIKEPKSQFDEDVQLAIAVSSSLAAQNKSEADILEENMLGITGKNKRRKKKQILEDVCLLTTLTNEDRQRRVEQKLNSVLVDENVDSDSEDDLPPLPCSSLRQSDTQTKLWQICNHDKSTDVLAFYVSALMPPIVANKLKTGSKLKRLSSIPGRDKTFIEPSADKSIMSPVAGEDVFTASTQTAVVLAELAVDDTVASNFTMLDQTATADTVASPNATGFCEETLGLKEGTLTHSRLETVNSFKCLINCREFSDLVIKTADNDTIHGHRAFIFTRFPSLKKLFQASDSSIALPLSKEACLIFMAYIYTGELSCTASIQHELIEMAEKLDIPLLKETCAALTTLKNQSTENIDDVNKSGEETVHLHPVLNMKDIWGESDSETDDIQGVRKEGTDTECEMDKQEPICDEDYNDIKCTQRKLVSHHGDYHSIADKVENDSVRTHLPHETKYSTVKNNVDSNDQYQEGSTKRCTQRTLVSHEDKLPTMKDELGNDDPVEESAIKCTQRTIISEEEDNYSAMEEIYNKEPSFDQDCDIKCTQRNSSSYRSERDSRYNQEPICEQDNKMKCTLSDKHSSMTGKVDKRSYISGLDLSDGENSMSSESDIMLLGNLCDNKSKSDGAIYDCRTNVPPMKEISNLEEETPKCSDKIRTIGNSFEDACDANIHNSTITDLQSSQASLNNSKLSETQSISSNTKFSPVNTVNSENNDQSKIDTSMVDLFESPMFNGTYIQPKETECSPTSSNSPLFNRKRKSSSQSSSCAIQLDLVTVDKKGKLNGSEKLSSVSGQFGKVETNDNLIENDIQDATVHNSTERTEGEFVILNEKYSGNKPENSRQSKYLGLHYSPSKSNSLYHKHSDLHKGFTYSSENKIDSEPTQSDEDDLHVSLQGLDKRNKSLRVDECDKSDDLGEEIDLISCDSDNEADIHADDVGLDVSESRNNIQGQDDVWEDFDDYGMGYTDILSPVLSQESPSHNDDKNDTLTDQLNKDEITMDNLINVDLDDKDDSFVFHVSEGKPSQKSQSNSFKTPTVKNKIREKKVWVPPSPFTPMPDYDSMNTPLLKKEVKKYGVRPVSKKRMVTVLKDIYHKTHQYETDSEFEDEVETITTYTDLVQSPSKHSDILSQDSVASSQEADTNDMNDVMEESIMLDGSTSESDTQSSPQKGVDVKKKMHHYIITNPDLHIRVLMYEPLEIDVLKADMKEAGIKCSMDKLLEFLDEKCIAFTSKNTRKRAQSKRGRKKASPKKQNKTKDIQNDS